MTPAEQFAQMNLEASALAQLTKQGDDVSESGFSPRIARRSIIHFTQATYPEYVPEAFHYKLAEAIDRIVNGEGKRRLMIIAPPRHGKSEICSVRLPAYWLGKNPNKPIIATSSGATLAEDFSGQAKTLVQSDTYREIFPYVRLKGDTTAKDFWRISGYLGYLRAAGFGGNIMGRGADLALIDDPIASWAEAQSQVTRDKVWQWYTGTLRHRLHKFGSIVLIQTRWHEDDLAGRLLLNQPGLWEVLRFPALAETQEERDQYAEKYGLPKGEPDPLGREPGEILAPERMPKSEMESIKVELGSMVFSALYQGSPRPPEGNVFKDWWFPPEIFLTQAEIEYQTEFIALVRYWDKAGTEGAGAFTVGLLMGYGADGLIYVLDVQREQYGPSRRNEMIKAMAKKDYQKYGHNCAIWIEQEPGSGGKESAQISLKDLAGFNVRIDPVGDSKEVRIRPFAAYCEAGMVRIKKDPRWNTAYIAELLEFSETAKYKDQADASAGAYNHLTLEPGMAQDSVRQLADSIRGGRRGNAPKRR